jgi:hypothetical protein
MANLAESQVWENGIYQIERTDVVDAGVAGNGIANLQAKLLANRTAYLKQVLDAAGLGVGGLDSDLVAIAQLTTTPFGRAFLTLLDAAAARSYISAQQQDADLDAIAALATTVFGRSLLTVVDAAAGRAALSVQAQNTNLDAIAALVTTAFGRGFLPLADATAARSYINAQTQDADLDAIAALVTTAFGRNLLTLADAAGVRGYLSAQQQDADLDAIAALVTTAFGRNLLTLADAAAGRTALSAQAQDADLDAIAALATTGLVRRTGLGTAATVSVWVDNSICQGRLTLSGGNPIPSGNITAATTLYFAPYNGNRIALRVGTEWELRTFSELSLTLTGTIANTNYDVFVFDNAGNLTLELIAWTNGTTRSVAGAISRLDGIWIKTSDNRRYLGTIRTIAAGQCNDSQSERFVYNVQNQVFRKALVSAPALSYTYSSNILRPVGGSSVVRIQSVCGVEQIVQLKASMLTSGSATDDFDLSIGVNSTTVSTADIVGSVTGLAASYQVSFLDIEAALGYSYYQAIEMVITGTLTAAAPKITGLITC